MSWLSDRTGIHIDLKKYAPFLMAPGGIGGVLQGEVIKNGGNISQIPGSLTGDLKTGASNVPMTLGVSKMMPQGGVTGAPGSPGGAGGVGDGVIPKINDDTMKLIQQYLSGQGGGGGMDIEKWLLLLNGLSGVAGGVGSFLEGKNYNDRMKEQLAEQQREFNATNELNQKQFGETQRQFNIPQATQLSRSQDLAPLRDRATYMLSQRLGSAPGAFSPATLTQPGAQGGIDLGKMQQANNAYQPWQGGTKPGVDIRQQILQSLGYGG